MSVGHSRRRSFDRPSAGAESLEIRALLTVLLDPVSGLLSIIGSPKPDTAVVESVASDIRVTLGQEVFLFPGASVSHIQFSGQGGNDLFRNLTAIPCIAMGGSGSDTLEGGAGNDVLRGGPGRDSLAGNAGNDLLRAQGGSRESLNGGDGDDVLDGGRGRDVVVATISGQVVLTNSSMTGQGRDSLRNIRQADITGEAGPDRIDATDFTGGVTLRGGGGSDTLYGGSGTSMLYGDIGNDVLYGGTEQDVLYGGPGADLLLGGNGSDVLNGGDGADTLTGGSGDDTLDGGAGTDWVDEQNNTWFRLTDSQLTGSGTDHLVSVERARLAGGGAKNLIDAGGFGGMTFLTGGDGDDTLIGGRGQDALSGGDGDDSLSGGDGADFLVGGLGVDVLSGGTGEDILTGARFLYGTDTDAMVAILTAWNPAGQTYEQRRLAVESVNLSSRLAIWSTGSGSGGTVYEDYAADILSGGDGQDLFFRPTETTSGRMDQIIDAAIDEAVETLISSSTPMQFIASSMGLPDYLQTAIDPSSGSEFIRITGEAGDQLVLPIVTIGSTPRFSTTSTYWGRAVRNRYVTDSAWNSDGTLIQIQSSGPDVSWQMLVDGRHDSETYLQPLSIVRLPAGQFRWSMDPARPAVQYAFPSMLDENLASESSPNDHLIFEYDVLSGQLLRTIELPFDKFAAGKTTIALVDGREYIALVGRERGNRLAEPQLYVVDLTTTDDTARIVAQSPLSTSRGMPNPTTLRYSPDGSQALLSYPGGKGRSWRLLDIDLNSGQVSPHAQPEMPEQPFETAEDRDAGFMAANWGHPVFAAGANGTDIYVVGNAGNFDGRLMPSVETFHGGTSQVGTLVAFNTVTGKYRSLNDSTPGQPATTVGHVSATATSRPGYVFASFGVRAGTGDYAGAIVAFSLDDPEGISGAIPIISHRSDAEAGGYAGQVHPVTSLDGSQLLFSSTWSTGLSVVNSFIVDLHLPGPVGSVDETLLDDGLDPDSGIDPLL